MDGNDPAASRLRHLDLLADAAVAGLEDEGESRWGLDGKRPFGFSGRSGIGSSVLEVVGVAPDGAEEPGCYSDAQVDYATGLFEDLIGHLQARWAGFREGEARGDGWISVRDRLPEPGKRVDVWRTHSGREPDCVFFHRSAYGIAHWNLPYGGYAGGATVTHWREVPPAPGDAKGE
jgi:hypothetical protein